MMKLFDYIFYRIYKFYVRRKNELADSFASSLLSLMQFLILVDIIFVAKILLNFTIPNKVYFIPVIVLLIGINWYRYERDDFDLELLEGQWKDEDAGIRKRNGWLIVLSLIGSLLFPVLYGILKHNLGVI